LERVVLRRSIAASAEPPCPVDAASAEADAQGLRILRLPDV